MACPRYWSDWFWKRAGGRSGYPADIAYAATCALYVYVEEVADLTPGSAAALCRTRVRLWQSDCSCRGAACMDASSSARVEAAILVEKSDDEAEKRFTIAHEVTLHPGSEATPRARVGQAGA